MQGFMIRLAKALNGLWGRRGKVWAERYFAQLVRSPTVMRNTLAYVLKNAMRHGVRLAQRIDPLSSGRWFEGWREIAPSKASPSPVTPPRFWLLRTGWHRAGPIPVDSAPGPTR